MKILVPGATGYIGSVVADALAEAGREVTGLARSTEAARSLQQRNIRPHFGDLSDPQSLTLAAGEADAVIHTALPHGPDAPQADKNAVRTFPGTLEESGKPFTYTTSSISSHWTDKIFGRFLLYFPPLETGRGKRAGTSCLCCAESESPLFCAPHDAGAASLGAKLAASKSKFRMMK